MKIDQLDSDNSISDFGQSYNVIIDMIFAGTLRENSPFTERDLANKSNSTKMVIRDQIKELSHMNIVTQVPQSGSFINSFDDNDKAQIMNQRHYCETESALRLINSFMDTKKSRQEKEDMLAPLISTMDVMRESGSRGDYKMFFYADMQFHTEISRIAGNNFYAAWVEKLFVVVFLTNQSRIIFKADDPGMIIRRQYERTIAEHMRIYSYILKCKKDYAATAISKHIADVEKNWTHALLLWNAEELKARSTSKFFRPSFVQPSEVKS